MKISYKVIEIDKKWIKENIKKPGWQRNLYPARVNFFINHIKNNTFRRSLITVAKDERNGKLILLDGQHKLESIQKSGSSLKMDLKVCEGMTEEEMMQEYQSLNNVKGHRIIDDIKLHIGRNDVLDSFLDEKIFPINVSLSGGINSIRIDRFLNILYNGTRLSMTRSNLSRKKLTYFLDNLDTERFILMKEFCSFFKVCFGDPFKENWLYSNMVMFTIMKFWFKNRDNFASSEMVKAFKPIMDSGSIQMEHRGVDIATMNNLSHKIYAVINKYRSKNKFMRFWAEEDGKKKEKQG